MPEVWIMAPCVVCKQEFRVTDMLSRAITMKDGRILRAAWCDTCREQERADEAREAANG